MILDKVDFSHIASAFKLRDYTYSGCSPASLSMPSGQSKHHIVLERRTRRPNRLPRNRCIVSRKRNLRACKTTPPSRRRTSKTQVGQKGSAIAHSTIRRPTSKGRHRNPYSTEIYRDRREGFRCILLRGPENCCQQRRNRRQNRVQVEGQGPVVKSASKSQKYEF